MPRRTLLHQQLTSNVSESLVKEKDKPVLKIFNDLITSSKKVRGKRREEFWTELRNLFTRLVLIKGYKETNDIYTEELEDRYEKERTRRQKFEFELSQKRSELSRLKSKYDNLLKSKQ